MKFEDLVRLYEEKKKIYGVETYTHISELLKEAYGRVYKVFDI